MTRIETPSFTYIHNQRKKKKMGEHKLPHCCTMKNITMARSFAPLLAYTHNQKEKEKKKELKLLHCCIMGNIVMVMLAPSSCGNKHT
jgi:Cys-tRNA synthase (O-phospho-L-seryl-tRNA:Cys-tRNA synthase)